MQSLVVERWLLFTEVERAGDVSPSTDNFCHTVEVSDYFLFYRLFVTVGCIDDVCLSIPPIK